MALPETFWQLAEHLMQVVCSETGFPVVVYDDKGFIARATDTSRIGDLHAGGQQIMLGLVDEYAVTPEEAARNPLVREGYSCPIVIDGERVAGFGISGKLEQTKPLAKVAARLFDSWIADQKHRDQLQRSERKFRSIIDHSFQGIFQSTLEGRLVTANAVLARMYAYASPEQLVAEISDLAHQLYVDAEDRTKLISQLEQKGSVSGFQTQFRRRDGQIIDVMINAHFVSDTETGQPLVEGIVEDITAKKQAKEALKVSEEKYFKAFNNVPAWVIISSLESGRYIEVNEHFLKTMGYRRSEIIGRTSIEIGSWVNPADRRKIQDIIKERGFVRNLEVKRRTKSGRILTMLFSAELLELANESCMVSVSKDIKTVIEAENRLKESHERFLTVLESLDATIYVADMESYEILYMNEKMKQLYHADLTGRKCHTALRGESQPCSICTNKQLLDANGDPAGVVVWEGQNPLTKRWFVNYDRAINWVDGRIARLQIAMDITENKRAENERQNYEERIRQMQKMEAIGMLAGGIAHDFNNILSAVIGYAELSLLDTDDRPEVQSNIQQIYEAGQRAKDLVRQILTFSRQDEDDLKPLQINTQIKEALKMLRSSLPSTIEIDARIAADVIHVLASPAQMQQIVMNLCTNAAQAMEDNGGRLRVGLSVADMTKEDLQKHPGLAPGSYARLSVQDTGSGITPENIDKIFDPYFTTKEKGKGTGLGLAVVHGIVQSYGGDIQVDSQLGRGTSFTILLPTIDAKTDGEPGHTPLAGGNERILLIDDEAAIVALGRQGLSRLGYDVEGFSSSSEALERFRQNPDRFDLVITDMTMPQLTGDKLAATMLQIRPSIPIILCTGYSNRIDSEQAQKSGIKAMLTKPLNLHELAINVRRILDEQDTDHNKPPL